MYLYDNSRIPLDVKLGKSVFLCNDCKRCETYCIYKPKDVLKNNRAAKKIVFDKNYAPEAVYGIEKNLKKYGNITAKKNDGPDKRSDSSDYPNPDFSKKTADILIYAGDYTRLFAPQLFDDFVKLLDHLGMDYAYDKNEVSDGMLALEFGMEEVAKELIKENCKRISNFNSDLMVVLSADSYYGFKKEYEKHGCRMKKNIMHYTEFLSKHIDKIKVNKTNDKIKYFDPCKLGRYSKIYEEPRNVLAGITSEKDIDFSKNREESKCCSGNISFFDNDLSKKIAEEVIDEFKRSGSDILITACPLCLHNFKNAENTKDLKIYDLLEYLIKNLKN